MTRGSLVALPCSTVARVGRRETSGLAFSKRYSFTWGTAGNAMEVGAANVTITGLVLVVLRASPFFKARRWRAAWLTCTVRSCCSVLIDDRNRTPTTQVMH